MDRSGKIIICLLIVISVAFSGCAQHVKIPTEHVHNVYTVQNIKDDPDTHFAPLFLTYDFSKRYNAIGRPSARYDQNGKERIYVDDNYPVMYYSIQRFSTDNGEYTNYTYRVHFPSVPFSLVPFHLSAGKNVGLVIVITVDSKNNPVLVTSVHTCGCYLAIIPTSYLSSEYFPPDWKNMALKVYGERLPPLLGYKETKEPKLLVHLRTDVHRVMDLEVIEEDVIHENRLFNIITTPLVPMEKLERIPINGKTTSFYYEKGLLKGHVKGSLKFWETIFLSPISLDLFVGADKAYSDTSVTGNPFYTSLKPWNRKSSDMWNFKVFLEFWGWRL